MTEYWSQPDDPGEPDTSQFQYSLGQQLGAKAHEAWEGLPLVGMFRNEEKMLAGGQLGGLTELGLSGGTGMPAFGQQDFREQIARAAGNDMPMAEAKKRLSQEGLDQQVKLPVQEGIKPAVLELMIQRGHEERLRQQVIDKGPSGFVSGALGFATELGVGMIDPLNIAAFSIPVLGEARWGKIAANVGDSLLGRASVNALKGATQGAVGGVALAPAEWWLQTADGKDFTFASALQSVVMSAGMGAAFHTGIAAIKDLRARFKDVPKHPAEVLSELPPNVQENVVQAAMADVINDRPGRVGEMLEEAGKADPKIAEATTPFPSYDPFEMARSGELSSDRAKEIAEELKGRGKTIEDQILGEDAEAWRRAHRASERYWNAAEDAKAEAQDKIIGDIEDKLSPENQNRLYQGESPETWKDLARDLQAVEVDRDDAVQVLAYRLRNLPDGSQPLTELQKEKLAVIQHAMSEEAKRGGDPERLLKDAFKHSAERYGEGEMTANAKELVGEDIARLKKLMENPPEPAKQIPDWKSLQTEKTRPEDREINTLSQEGEKAPTPVTIDDAQMKKAVDDALIEAQKVMDDMKDILDDQSRAELDKKLIELDMNENRQTLATEEYIACLRKGTA